jgi:hypothetical protein
MLPEPYIAQAFKEGRNLSSGDIGSPATIPAVDEGPG